MRRINASVKIELTIILNIVLKKSVNLKTSIKKRLVW